MAPLVHILLASHNRYDLIKETLTSIVKQTHKNWECIIVDDFSSEKTIEIIKDFTKNDARFHLFPKTNEYRRGLAGTRNMGLDIARERKAEFVQFFDDDDLMDPKKLELQLIPFQENNNLNFSICKYYKFSTNENGIEQLSKPYFNFKHEHLGDAIITGAIKMNSANVVWNMKILDQFRFDEDLEYAEEWELYTRIGYKFPANYAIVDDYLFKYRKHHKSLTLSKENLYLRKKASAIIRIKLMNYLTENSCHTKNSIIFFFKTFSLYNYEPIYLNRLLTLVKEDRKFPSPLGWYLSFGIKSGKFYRKLITKLASLI